MAVVATITIGADNFSVYGLTADPLADANSYFAGRLGVTAWTAATDDTKRAALVTAVRMLDRRVLWSGTKTVSSQPLQWPRDGATCRSEAVPDGTIPDDIALGEFELALALLEDEAIQDSNNTGTNLKRAKAGSAEVEFFQPTRAGGIGVHKFPQVVHELVGCYSAGAANREGPFVDGTNPANADESSHFCSDDNDYGLTQGYR